MSTAGAASEGAPQVSNTSTEALADTHALHVFLTRGLIAIAWAIVFAAASDSLTFGVGVLLVLYPLIDVVASAIDARGQQGSARQLLLANAAVSAAAAVALGIAATGDKGNVLAVFGVWALLAGVAQLGVAIRRRAIFGRQLPLLIAGAGSTIWGIAFLVMSSRNDPPLRMIAAYAGGGGLEFVIQAWLLARRRPPRYAASRNLSRA